MLQQRDRTVRCWGRGSEGQLGDNRNTNSRIAVDVDGLTDVVSLAAGFQHTCAVKEEGSFGVGVPESTVS